MRSQKSRRSFLLLKGFLLCSAYAALAAATTWPLVTKLSTHLPDRFNDALLHSWNTWWVGEALGNGQFPYYTTYLFYPGGVSLATHNIAWFHVIPSLLLRPFVNAVAAYNLAVLLNVVLCGLAAFWLTSRLTGDWRAGFVGGVIYQTWPYRLARLDLPNLLATYWIPLFVLYLILTLRHGRRRDAVLTGICFALVGYTRWQLLIPAAVIGALYFVCAFPQWLPPARRAVLGRLPAAAGVALLLLTPPLALLVQTQAEAGAADLVYAGEEVKLSADLLAFLTPGEHHPLWGDRTEPRYERYYTDREDARRRPAYVGLVAGALALLGVYVRGRKSAPWLVILAVMALLALGPVARVNGALYERTPTLYGLLEPLNLLRLLRNPERFTMFVALPVAVLAAYGTAALLRPRRLQTAPYRPALLALLLSGLVVLDYLQVQTVFKDVSHPPAVYAQIAAEAGDFAILNLPFDDLKGSLYMYAQTHHQRPILQGNLSRIPPNAYDYANQTPILGSLRYTNEIAPDLGDVSHQLGDLAEDDIGYIIMHKDLVGADRIQHWQRYLLSAPRYADDRLIVYTTAPTAGRDFTLAAELTAGLGPVRIWQPTTCVRPGDTFEVDVGWGSIQAVERTFELRLALVDTGGRVQQTAQFPLIPYRNALAWSAGTLAWGYYPFSVEPDLPPGEYTLTAALVDAVTGRPEPDTLALQPLTLQSAPCPADLPAEARATGANYGDLLRLKAYTIERESQRLDLTLYWEAIQRMQTEYTIFVHVFDPATGVPAAQNDAPPRQGALPTRFWWPGELLDDRIAISLDGLAPGEYGIAVGVYDPATGERLPLETAGGEWVEDGRFILTETVEVARDFSAAGVAAQTAAQTAAHIAAHRAAHKDNGLTPFNID